MKSLVPFLAAVALLPLAARAQSVGVGTATPSAKAALDITATDKGLLIPRLTAAQRTGIAAPPQGLMVYQTDGTASGGTQTGFWYYAGTPATWVFLSPAGDNLGNHTATQNLTLADNDLLLHTAADDNDKLTYDATTAGPALTGTTGGVLGYRSSGTTTPVLQWANVSGNSRVGIGLASGTPPSRTLDVNGAVRLRNLSTAGVVLTDGTGVLSSEANQTLTVSGQTLTISGTGGNSVTLPSSTASGTAGGDLTGTYPNPTLAAGVVTTTALADNAVTNLKMADDAVGIAELSATGTASNTTFLRGDNSWAPLASGAWGLSGNTTDGSQFIGTLNNQDFVVKRNNTEAFRVYSNGRISVGNSSPFSSSVMLGFNAGVALTSAYYNTFVGAKAGESNTNGSNTLIGYGAGQQSTGSNNTMLGFYAGNRVTGGDNNVFIGNQAVYINGSSAVGNGNVVVGSGAGMTLNGNSSNNLLLGNSASASAGLYDAYAIGSNASVTQNNSLAIGDARGTNNAVSVGIGTSAPSSTLQVTGTFAVGVVNNFGGGTSGNFNAIDQGTTQNNSTVGGYYGLAPTSASNQYYRLPDPGTCPGRVYYLRNNSGTTTAILNVSSGQLIDSASGSGTSQYTLNTSGSSKTVIAVSDGTNWTIMRTGS